MIFQDPMTSLNPLLTIGRQLTEVLEVHERVTRREARRRAAKGLDDVGIPEPEKRLDQYPHELSGGMRQRVMMPGAARSPCPARGRADDRPRRHDPGPDPRADEVAQESHGTAIVLVTHDLGVVAGMSDRVNVMYAGKLVETASAEALFESPRHLYTAGLLGRCPGRRHRRGPD